jgi:5-(carboxyamino)imidazole ribonucleotide mutase
VEKVEIVVIAGSKSDKKYVDTVAEILDRFNVAYELHYCSAHRDPDRLGKIIQESENAGARVFIAAAGMAAHLPGVVASKTLKPVIGLPLGGSALNGVDSLYSIVQMPKGIPVACVGINVAQNAAYLALQILALNDMDISSQLLADRDQQKS